MTKSALGVGLVLVSALFLTGCNKGGGKGVVPVTGVVTLDGAPVEGASVTFAPGEGAGTSAAGMTDKDGKFTLLTAGAGAGAMPGSYKVLVSKTSGGPTASQPKSQEEAMREIQEKMKTGSLVPKAPPTMQDLLPVKYKTAATTDLKAEVKKGEKNEFAFALQK